MFKQLALCSGVAAVVILAGGCGSDSDATRSATDQLWRNPVGIGETVA